MKVEAAERGWRALQRFAPAARDSLPPLLRRRREYRSGVEESVASFFLSSRDRDSLPPFPHPLLLSTAFEITKRSIERHKFCKSASRAISSRRKGGATTLNVATGEETPAIGADRRCPLPRSSKRARAYGLSRRTVHGEPIAVFHGASKHGAMFAPPPNARAFGNTIFYNYLPNGKREKREKDLRADPDTYTRTVVVHACVAR